MTVIYPSHPLNFDVNSEFSQLSALSKVHAVLCHHHVSCLIFKQG